MGITLIYQVHVHLALYTWLQFPCHNKLNREERGETRTIRRHGGKIRWQTRWRACNETPLRNHGGGKVAADKRLALARVLFARSLSVTMCSLGRVNILLSSARPRTIRLYASARWLAKTSGPHNRVVGLISSVRLLRAAALEFLVGEFISRFAEFALSSFILIPLA